VMKRELVAFEVVSVMLTEVGIQQELGRVCEGAGPDAKEAGLAERG